MAITTTTTTTTTKYRTRRSPLTLGIAAFLVLIASLFFWLSAFSTPFLKSIYYVKTGALQDGGVKASASLSVFFYGTFGWCAFDNTVCYRHVGYARYPEIMDKTHLTGSLILVAFTAAFGTLAFFSLLHSIRDLRSGFCSFFLTILSAFLATLSFLLVVICFGVAHHRFNREHLDAHYGAALPLVIVGWLVFLAAIPLIIIGWFRERHYKHETTTTTTPQKRWF